MSPANKEKTHKLNRTTRTVVSVGNQKLSDATSADRRPLTLRIELEDWEGGTHVAFYGNFYIKSQDDHYQINLGAYSGNASRYTPEGHRATFPF